MWLNISQNHCARYDMKDRVDRSTVIQMRTRPLRYAALSVLRTCRALFSMQLEVSRQCQKLRSRVSTVILCYYWLWAVVAWFRQREVVVGN
jgi:hypothetical protein